MGSDMQSLGGRGKLTWGVSVLNLKIFTYWLSGAGRWSGEGGICRQSPVSSQGGLLGCCLRGALGVSEQLCGWRRGICG